MRVLRIDKSTSVIVNIEMWSVQPPDSGDEFFIVSDAGSIGDTYQNNVVVPATVPLVIATYTPAQVVAAFTVMGIATAVLTNTDELTKARFYTAIAIREDAPELLAALQGSGKTIDGFKAVVV